MGWTFLLIILILALILAYPAWPYSRAWGYVPTGVVTAVLILILLLAFLGYVTLWYPWAPAAY